MVAGIWEVALAGFRLSTMQGVTRMREQEERARLAESRNQQRKVNIRREQLQWDMSAANTHSTSSAAMSAMAASRNHRLTQSFQLDALLGEKVMATEQAEKQWTDAAQRAAAIDKLHVRFQLVQRAKEAKDERDQAQEAAQIQWLKNRKDA